MFGGRGDCNNENYSGIDRPGCGGGSYVMDTTE